MGNTIQQQIERKLRESLQPQELQVINESHGHNVPEGSESHFKLIIVSPVFDGLRLIQRQQKVYQILSEEIAGSVHALTMQTLTPDEWSADSIVKSSPNCMGGGRS